MYAFGRKTEAARRYIDNAFRFDNKKLVFDDISVGSERKTHFYKRSPQR
jgi:hypothetical protein